MTMTSLCQKAKMTIESMWETILFLMVQPSRFMLFTRSGEKPFGTKIMHKKQRGENNPRKGQIEWSKKGNTSITKGLTVRLCFNLICVGWAEITILSLSLFLFFHPF